MMDAVTSWRFYNPVRIQFGRGCREQLLKELDGRRLLVVTTPRGRRQLESDDILGPLFNDNCAIHWADNVQANPGLSELQTDIERLRGEAFDATVAFGGGSAIDSAKVLNVALAESVSDLSLREMLANAERQPTIQPWPLYALPTTAGTGSEVTPYSTVWDHEKRKKHSLAGPAVFPRTAIVDPALTDEMPNEVTLATGLDAINQAAESIWNYNMTPVSEGVATRALQLGFEALRRLLNEPGDTRGRDAMAECSLLAGLAISQTRTALCHSISYPMTAHFGVPHGLACAFTMPAVLRHNLAADDGRFERLAAVLEGGESSYTALLERFEGLTVSLGVGEQVKQKVPALEQLTALIGEMYTPGRADNNLAVVDEAAIKKILVTAWG
jgi:alcohol dehydrogenase